MPKSWKPKDNNYIDSTGIVHEKELLSNIIENMKFKNNDLTYLDDSIDTSKTTSHCYYNNNIMIFSCEIYFKSIPSNVKNIKFIKFAQNLDGAKSLVNNLINIDSMKGIRIRVASDGVYFWYTSPIINYYYNGLFVIPIIN